LEDIAEGKGGRIGKGWEEAVADGSPGLDSRRRTTVVVNGGGAFVWKVDRDGSVFVYVLDG
jgi:hypothetical protein